jgi:hypothetical protein
MLYIHVETEHWECKMHGTHPVKPQLQNHHFVKDLRYKRHFQTCGFAGARWAIYTCRNRSSWKQKNIPKYCSATHYVRYHGDLQFCFSKYFITTFAFLSVLMRIYLHKSVTRGQKEWQIFCVLS